MITTEKDILDLLKNLGIAYDYVAHEPFFTVEQIVRAGHKVDDSDSKNLFIRDKKHKKWLLTIPATKRANLKEIAVKLGTKDLSFCSPDDLLATLGVPAGSATPLAIINDMANQVTLVMDETLMNTGKILCHPMHNAATITLASGDLKKFIQHAGHDIVVLPLV